MFKCFTNYACWVVVLAQGEARGLKYNYIGTEYLLLGLISEGRGVVAKALETIEIKDEVVRASVIEIIDEGEKPVEGHIPFIPCAKCILELSPREVLQLGHNCIGTEYLLLDLLKEGEGVAVQVLTKQGAGLAQVCRIAIQMPSGYQCGDDESREFVDAGVGGSGGSRRSNSAILEQFSHNLAQVVCKNKLDPVTGRQAKTEYVIQVLSRRTKNSPVLIGEPGVGETAVVEDLAQVIVHSDAPETIKDKQIYSLGMESLVMDLRYRGGFERHLKKVLKETHTRDDVILFVDEIHILASADATEGSIGAAQILKPMLAHGELRAAGATTSDEYRKYIEKDAALGRRFQLVKVEESSVDKMVGILKGLHDHYEARHRAIITDATIQVAAELMDRYVSDRFLPDKATDLVDGAGARLRICHVTAPPELREIDKRTAGVRRNKETATDDQDFEKTASLRNEESKLNEERKTKEEVWKGGESGKIAEVGDQEIAEALAMSTGIPVTRLTRAGAAELPKMEGELHKHVIGQDEAVRALTQSTRRTRSGLKDPNRPGGSFVFAGPAGVGKAELAKALAELLSGDEDALIQLDMSGFPEKHVVLRLLDASPGYVGYDEGGQPMEKVHRKSFSAVPLDKIEKAHPDIFNSLSQILKGGRLTDSQGRKVDFRNTVIIMATNLDARDINKDVLTGFQTADDSTHDYGRMKSEVAEELKQHLRSEFLSHVDDTIVFPPLTRPETSHTVNLAIAKLVKRMEAQDTHLQLTGDARKLLAGVGFDPALDTCSLRRVIQREVENALPERILFGEL